MDTGLVEAIGSLPISETLTGSLARAANYARDQAHAEVALEHLLLSLTEDPDALRILTLSGVDIERLASDVSNHLGRIEDHLPPGGAEAPAVSEDLKRILKGAAAAARGRRREIDGAIVLAAVVGDAKSSAAHILSGQGLTFDTAIRALQSALDATPQAAPSGPQTGYDAASDPSPAAPGTAPPSQAERAPPRPDRPQDRPPPNAIIAAARSKVQSRQAASETFTAAPGQSQVDEASESANRARQDDGAAGSDEAVLSRLELARRAYEERRYAASEAAEGASQSGAGFSETPGDVDRRRPGAGSQQLDAAHAAAPLQGDRPGDVGDDEDLAHRSIARAGYRLPVSPPIAGGRPMSPRPRPIPQPHERRAPPASELMAERDLRPPDAPSPTPEPAARAAPPSRVPHPPTSAASHKPQLPRDNRQPQPPAPPPPHYTDPEARRPDAPRGPDSHVTPASANHRPQHHQHPSHDFGGRPPAPPPPPQPAQHLPPHAQHRAMPPPRPGSGMPPQTSRQAPGRPPQPPPPGFRPIPPPRPAGPTPASDPRHAHATAPPPLAQRAQHGNAPRPVPAHQVERIGDHELTAFIPPRLMAGRTTIIEIELPRSKLVGLNLARNFASADGSAGDIVAPTAVVLRLRAPEGGFFIEPISTETQWLGNTNDGTGPPLCWRWNVTPKRSGRYPLQALIAGRTIGRDGFAAEAALPGQSANVRVRGDVAKWAARTAGLVGAFALGAALTLFSGPILDFAQTGLRTLSGGGS